MMSAAQRVRMIRVGRRVYRKIAQRDRRRKLEYAHPELRLSNAWLRAAGFAPGDLVFVSSPQPRALVITLARRAVEPPRESPEGGG